jgi:hypothetical protein
MGEFMRYLIILFLFGLTFTSAIAHHSSSIFEKDHEIVLEGVVSGYDWKNPHIYIYVDAEDDNGQLIRWQIEGEDIRTMTRSGWTTTTLVAGERVVVRAHPDRNVKRHHALMTSLSKPDGSTLMPELSEMPAPTVAATNIFGLWDHAQGRVRFVNWGTPSEKGTAAVEEFNRVDSPTSQCIPPTAPRVMMGDDLIRISMQNERILIQTEEYQVERIVYMDEREHQANGERTSQGHSIGWWEGGDDILVIDTTLFSEQRTGHRALGLPSGAQKHLVERFELTEDGTQLKYDFVVEDPEYLQEPITGVTVLDHSPNETMIRSGCDPESARAWIFE